MLKQLILLLLLILGFQSVFYGQRRISRTPLPATINNHQDSIAGRFFNVRFINNDTVPVLLKFGPWGQIDNNDTLNLARTNSCSNPSITAYYALNNFVNEEDNCVNWYRLKLFKPMDTLQFVVKLKDFCEADRARLYFHYTKEVTKMDRELGLYSNPEKVYVMKEVRDFESGYAIIPQKTSDVISLQITYNK